METITISSLGALIALCIAILLIIKKFNPAYSLILASVIGGLIGGASLNQTIKFMVSGAQSIIPAVLRIITAGVLAGILVETGAANQIAKTIISKLGEKRL